MIRMISVSDVQLVIHLTLSVLVTLGLMAIIAPKRVKIVVTVGMGSVKITHANVVMATVALIASSIRDRVLKKTNVSM